MNLRKINILTLQLLTIGFLFNLNKELVVFNVKKMANDLSRGLYFDSSIPMGYGVGSSGALVAAFYDRYALDKITVLENLTSDKLSFLKRTFAQMESFFHGRSSGLDPLNSYLSLPILIHSKDQIEPTGLPAQNPHGKGAVFLLDSGISGETAPMISLFLENMKKESFSNMMRDEFTTVTDFCVEDFLKGNIKSLFKNIKSLSSIVLKYFRPMIPSEFHDLWKKGIETNTYYLKLCGSGGGGFLLGFTKDYEATEKVLKGYGLKPIYHF